MLGAKAEVRRPRLALLAEPTVHLELPCLLSPTNSAGRQRLVRAPACRANSFVQLAAIRRPPKMSSLGDFLAVVPQHAGDEGGRHRKLDRPGFVRRLLPLTFKKRRVEELHGTSNAQSTRLHEKGSARDHERSCLHEGRREQLRDLQLAAGRYPNSVANSNSAHSLEGSDSNGRGCFPMSFGPRRGAARAQRAWGLVGNAGLGIGWASQARTCSS